ncbi:MAG: hypothetical protein ABIH24_09460 [Verrucomicrobiota bacterium]
MIISDRYFFIRIERDRLIVRRRDTGKSLCLKWPAVRLSLNGQVLAPACADQEPRISGKTVSQQFTAGQMTFTVSVALTNRLWIKKCLSVRANQALSTPDFVEMDRQDLPSDNLCLCGYRATTLSVSKKSDEEGVGGISGCGYPLLGRTLFLGLEHPAAFNLVKHRSGKDQVRLKHYPVWQGNQLEEVAEVLGWADDARMNFADYLDTIRLPPLKKPFVSFCTFWSDPYLGKNEYATSRDAYLAYIQAFKTLGLIPDVFTLDAGWLDRRTILAAKQEVGRDDGLRQLSRIALRMGASLGLWASRNGPMAFDSKFLRSRGFAVGGGNSAAYCGKNYAVLMESSLVETLSQRFCDLTGRVGARHFKMDWDNECATNPKFARRYPTVNHVRQASLNAYFAIARRILKANPRVIIRDGYWPSPWWLSSGHHPFLSDSGDSEFSSLPAKTQRDAASTHRDLMYYNHLVRDGAPLPLDCWDNHELPSAPRNPFADTPESWTNAIWLSFLRGTTYLTYTLMPETLEPWQVESLKSIMRFCRANAAHIYGTRGRMILGHPGHGEIYGFIHPGQKESWCVVRNPKPVPQTFGLDLMQGCPHSIRRILQFYPHNEAFWPGQTITMLAHEVRIFILCSKPETWQFGHPHMMNADDNKIAYHFPATLAVNAKVQPMVHHLHRFADLKCLSIKMKKTADSLQSEWFLASPYRMRNLEAQLCIRSCVAPRVTAFCSRYQDAHGGYSLPVTTLAPGQPGYGEQRNLESVCRSDETYYAIRVPSCGRFLLSVTIHGGKFDLDNISAWLAGYEAPSRAGIYARPPRRFAKCMPYPHPLGFGRALRLPILA